jgi:hypothetical protein
MRQKDESNNIRIISENMPISITGAARAFSLEGGVQPKNLLTNLRL